MDFSWNEASQKMTNYPLPDLLTYSSLFGCNFTNYFSFSHIIIIIICIQTINGNLISFQHWNNLKQNIYSLNDDNDIDNTIIIKLPALIANKHDFKFQSK